MVAKYELALTEFNHPEIHGNSIKLYSHHMCFLKITPDELYKEYPQEYAVLNQSYMSCQNTHPLIQCYIDILRKKGVLHLNIVESHELPTGEIVCILKTYCLRIFQRKWRTYVTKKLAFFKNPKSLMIREINGSFHKSF